MRNDNNVTYLTKKEEYSATSWKQKFYLAITSHPPLPQPQIIPDLEQRPFLERITETLCYSVLSFEYAISPNGGLRQWFKINIAFLLLFGIPILSFAPLITFFMLKFTSITTYLFQSALNILLSVLSLTATVSLIWGTYKLFVFLRYTEKRVKKQREQEFSRIQQEAQSKRDEEFQRLNAEFQKRRDEEFSRIEAEVRKNRDAEYLRVEADIRKRRTEENQRIDKEIHAKREEAQQEIETESRKRLEEDRQKVESEVQHVLAEERKKIIREARKRIQEWKAQLHTYDQLCESPIEEQFWNVAKHRLLGLIPQYEIGRYRIDFVLPEEHLAIELDGHDYHKTKAQRTNDAKRERDLQELGWHVIRFTGTEVYRDVENCVQQIERICQTFLE